MPLITAASIMNRSAVLVNDASLSTYTYAVQIPLLNQAMQELQEIFELNNIPATDATTSEPINIPTGISEVGFDTVPTLPSNLIEPKMLWERPENSDPYVKMTRVDYLSKELEGVEINQLCNYVWADQKLKFLPANQDNDIKIDYIRSLFSTINQSTDMISLVNSQSFLQFRTAALICETIERNDELADKHNMNASLALDRVVGIGTKGRQAINIRHRPFRSGFKRRNSL